MFAAMQYDAQGLMTAMATTQQTKFPEFDIGRYFGDFPVPAFDLESVAASQRRNLDALTQANRLAYEGFQAMAKRHVEAVHQTMDEFAQAAKTISEPGTAQDKAIKQAEMAKGAVERGVSTIREMTEMLARTNSDALELLNRRLVQGMEEMRDAFQKGTSRR